MLAMTLIYEGHKELGIELARKVCHNLVCVQGYTWDIPCMTGGALDTGDRQPGPGGYDYYQFMMLWSLPAAIYGKDLSMPTKSGGLIDRIKRAAWEKENRKT